MDARANTGLLILGMHRSGTSALSRVCNLLGAELGPRLLEAAEDNERGFWEHKDILDLQEDLLDAALSHWNEITPVNLESLAGETSEKFKQALQSILTRDFQHAPLWAVKEPRLSLFLPLWRAPLSALDADINCILCLRHPLEVAASLTRRNKMPASTGVALWLHYTLMAELHSRPYPRMVVSYASLLGDWRGCTRRIAETLRFSWMRSENEAGAQIDAYLSPALKHHEADKELSDESRWSKWAAEIYRSLLKSSQTGSIDTDLFDTVRGQWLKEAEPFAYTVSDKRHQLLDMWKTEKSLRNIEAELRGILNERDALIADFHHHINRIQAEKASQYEAMKKEIDRLAVQMEKFLSSTSWRITAPLRMIMRFALKLLGRWPKS